MILLDSDILTLWLLGQPLVSKGVLGSPDGIATTVISRIEILQGRFAYLLKASDGVKLQAAQSRLDQTERQLQGLIVIPFDARSAAEFDRHPADQEPETHRPSRPADRQHRPCAESDPRHSEPNPLPPDLGTDTGELGGLTTGPLDR